MDAKEALLLAEVIETYTNRLYQEQMRFGVVQADTYSINLLNHLRTILDNYADKRRNLT